MTEKFMLDFPSKDFMLLMKISKFVLQVYELANEWHLDKIVDVLLSDSINYKRTKLVKLDSQDQTVCHQPQYLCKTIVTCQNR